MTTRTVPPLLVRAIEPEDYDQWRPLWDGYNAFYNRAGPTALPEAVTQTLWERFLAADPVHALVAVRDGRLIGLAHYLFHASTSAIEPNCYMQDLFASQAVRGQGVGRALIAAVCDAAQKAGTGRVYWHTHETNKAAQKLYDKVADKSGFIVYRCLF